MDGRQSGLADRCGPGPLGRSRRSAGPGCRRQRHSAGAGECARTQRLDQRSERHRQCGQGTGDPAAGDKPGCAAYSVLSRRHPDVPGAASGQVETTAICDIAIPPRGGQNGRQGEWQADRRQVSEHLPGMLRPDSLALIFTRAVCLVSRTRCSVLDDAPQSRDPWRSRWTRISSAPRSLCSGRAERGPGCAAQHPGHAFLIRLCGR